MSKMVNFCRIVCGGATGAKLLQHTIDPKCEFSLKREGGNVLISGMAPEGDYLLLFEISQKSCDSKKYKLMMWHLSSQGSSFAEGIGLPGQIGGWMFDEESGITHSDAWRRPTPHRTGKLVLQPGAYLQLEAMQNAWSPDTYLQKLNSAMEARGVRVYMGVDPVSDEVMKISDVLNELEFASEASKVLIVLSEAIGEELAWQAKAGQKPLYALIDSGNPAKGYAYQLSEFFHGCLDRIAPFMEAQAISREGMINRI